MKRSCSDRSRYGFVNRRLIDWIVSVVSVVVVDSLRLCCTSERLIVSTARCAVPIASFTPLAARSAWLATPSAALTIAPPMPGAMMFATVSQNDP